MWAVLARRRARGARVRDGMEPVERRIIAGTSAGSVMGALTAAGVSPSLMAAYAAGGGRELDELDARGRPGARAGSTTWPTAEASRCRRSGPAPGGWPSGRSCGRRATRRRVMAAGSRAVHLDQADHRPRRPLRRHALARPRELLGRRRRLPTGKRTAFGREGSPRGRRRRRRRRLVRDPRLLPPGQDRRPALRRRRHLLGLEPRPAERRGPRPRRLPEPDVLAGAGHAALAGRAGRRADARAGRPPPGPRGQEAPRARHRGPDPPAHRRGPRGHGHEPMARDRREEVIERAVRTTARQLRRRRGRPGVVLPKPARSAGRTAARPPSRLRATASPELDPLRPPGRPEWLTAMRTVSKTVNPGSNPGSPALASDPTAKMFSCAVASGHGLRLVVLAGAGYSPSPDPSRSIGAPDPTVVEVVQRPDRSVRAASATGTVAASARLSDVRLPARALSRRRPHSVSRRQSSLATDLPRRHLSGDRRRVPSRDRPHD